MRLPGYLLLDAQPTPGSIERKSQRSSRAPNNNGFLFSYVKIMYTSSCKNCFRVGPYQATPPLVLEENSLSSRHLLSPLVVGCQTDIHNFYD